MTSSLGVPLSVRVVRANGVNTAVAIFDAQGRSLVPLVVQYPIEKGGVFREMAYYTSAHPALLSPDLVASGSCLHSSHDESCGATPAREGRIHFAANC